MIKICVYLQPGQIISTHGALFLMNWAKKSISDMPPTLAFVE